MGDFPEQWRHVRDLDEGGQGHIYIVRCADDADPKEYVLKRLKNLKREDYFKNEIEAYRNLDHPNILRLRDTGHTPKGKPYIVSEYCEGGSLANYPAFASTLAGLKFFQKIVGAIAYAHAQACPVYHLDLKPENVLLRDGDPVVADFGICFIEDSQVTFTKEGQRGSLHYCAPELRNPKITDATRLSAADIYSLGKILFWLFTHEVYDGHEDDYGGRRLFQVYPKEPHFIFIDELITEMVTKEPGKRVASAATLVSRLDEIIRRIKARGHVLDLSVPQPCHYCGIGNYKPAHETTPMGQIFSHFPVFPNREMRRNPPQPPVMASNDSIYERLRYVAKMMLGTNSVFGNAAPMFMICDYCGNVQYFRFDYTEGGTGKNWLP